MTDDAQLVLITGPQAGRTVRLDRETLFIGRDPRNDVVIGHPQVSRRHALIIQQGDGWLVEDLNSTNGTFINGRRITGPRLLAAGDTVELGEAVVLTYRDPASASNDAVSDETTSSQAAADEPPPTAADRPPRQKPPGEPVALRPSVPAGPAPAPARRASAQTLVGRPAAPPRDRTWLWLGIGCAIVLLLAACAVLLALDTLQLPDLFPQPLPSLIPGLDYPPSMITPPTPL